jgi:hypothetical protein
MGHTYSTYFLLIETATEQSGIKKFHLPCKGTVD